MDKQLSQLTETQILEEIRKTFDHESMIGIDTDAIIESSATLEELLINIRHAINTRDSKRFITG